MLGSVQHAGPAEDSLPTLLRSRPKATGGLQKRGRPAPAALDISEEPINPSVPDIRVKNTFIDSAAQRSPSLEAFYRERAVHTCPSKHIGRLSGLWQEPVCAPPLQSELPPPTPCGLDFDMPAGDVTGGGGLPHHLPPYLQGGALAQLYAEMHGAAYYSHLFPGLFPPPALAPPPFISNAVASALLDARGPPISLLDALTTHVDYEVTLPSSSPPTAPPPPPPVFAPSAHLAAPLAPSAVAPASSAASTPPSAVSPVGVGGELPSMGSSGHAAGRCKPCAFLHTKGCENGYGCSFCHLCGPGEKKRRQKEKLEQRRAIRKAKIASAAAAAN